MIEGEAEVEAMEMDLPEEISETDLRVASTAQRRDTWPETVPNVYIFLCSEKTQGRRI